MPRARRLMSTIVTQRKRIAKRMDRRTDRCMEWMNGQADIYRCNIDMRAVARFRQMRRCSGDARDAIINSQKILRELILKRNAKAWLPLWCFDVFRAPLFRLLWTLENIKNFRAEK